MVYKMYNIRAGGLDKADLSTEQVQVPLQPAQQQDCESCPAGVGRTILTLAPVSTKNCEPEVWSCM